MGNLTVFNKPKILLLESNKEEANNLSEIISTKFNIVSASEEAKTLSLLQSNPKEFSTLLISDTFAFSILNKLKSIDSLKNIPVIIVLSSNTLKQESIEDKLSEYNIINYIRKPYKANLILNQLTNSIKIGDADRLVFELEHDELTNLYTRQAFLHKVEQIRRSNPDKQFCILAFDFDNFKYTNSLYGEKKCNEFLAYTAHKLVAKVPYALCGRFGGDQYILFMEFKDKVDMPLLNKIQQSILDSAPIPHQIVKTGIYAPIDSECSTVLCCDRAFLAIKKIKGIYGKNLAFFESTLLQQLLDEQRIIETMERGIQNNEFKIFYQPKHESISEKIAGAEALVRWEHPEYGFLLPTQFIPLFEKNGFISKLDSFILEQVCKDIKRWEENGFPIVPISVNISRLDLLNPNELDKQQKIIDSYNIKHEILHMEVTESLFSDNTDLIIKQLKLIRDKNFIIEMDDFGSGYSSLGSLSSFPLDILKMDISFVKNIKSNEIVIENIIKMAHRMGLLTIAEGVESEDQFRILKGLGCDIIQGFYFSKPLSQKDFEAYIKKTTVFKGNNNRSEGTQKNTNFNETMLLAANEVAESLPGGFFSCHADSNFDIIAFNTNLIKIYDCTSADEFRKFIDNSFNGLVLKDDYDLVMKEIHDQITPDNDIGSIDFRIKSKLGKIKFVRSFGRFVHTEKYGNIFYVFINDITEEKERLALKESERLKQIELTNIANKATKQNQAKNIFMYNIAKDVLPNLQAIINYTEEIQKNISNPSIINDILSKSRQSQENILNFTNNLIELSHFENKDITLSESPTDISLATERIFALIKETTENKKIKVEYWAEIINPYVYQDIFHTTDVVSNIISNAIKYTPEGGTIKFGIKQLPGTNDEECIVEFICEDNGIGISQDFLPFIYDEFAREDNEINNNVPSAGLGLTIAKKLITLMNGTIEISSKQNVGTCVKTTQRHRYAKKEDIDKNSTLTANL
ncbi:MAG: EAL domain-containing protein [Treponema sp.]|nr:EAL domain-containing protein [Treponema sp.]